MPESWAVSLQERFDAACRAAERRHERVVAAKALAEQAPDVVTQIESLAGAEDYNAIRSQWYALRKQWQTIARDSDLDAALVARYDQAAAGLEAREGEHREGRVRASRTTRRLQARAVELDRSAANRCTKDAKHILKKPSSSSARCSRRHRRDHKDPPPALLQASRSTVGAADHELRDAEEWKRWANAGAGGLRQMEAFIAAAEAGAGNARQRDHVGERWRSSRPRSIAPKSVDAEAAEPVHEK